MEEEVNIDELSAFPRSISKKELITLKEKINDSVSLTDEDKTLLIDTIDNAIFWKTKYIDLQESFISFAKDKKLDIIHTNYE